MVEPTSDMIGLQKKLIDTISTFMSPTGSAAAFATTAAEPTINEATLNAVATYFSEHTGAHYTPHVTIGVGTVDYLNALLAAPFPTFTFSAVGVSAYQFGNFGTAAKLLHSFKLTQSVSDAPTILDPVCRKPAAISRALAFTLNHSATSCAVNCN